MNEPKQVLVDLNDPRLLGPYDELCNEMSLAFETWYDGHTELSQHEKLAALIGCLDTMLKGAKIVGGATIIPGERKN